MFADFGYSDMNPPQLTSVAQAPPRRNHHGVHRGCNRSDLPIGQLFFPSSLWTLNQIGCAGARMCCVNIGSRRQPR